MDHREIRDTRKLLGLSQTQLSEMLGVHVVTLSKWERNIGHKPSPWHHALLERFRIATGDHRSTLVDEMMASRGVPYALFYLLELSFGLEGMDTVVVSMDHEGTHQGAGHEGTQVDQ